MKKLIKLSEHTPKRSLKQRKGCFNIYNWLVRLEVFPYFFYPANIFTPTHASQVKLADGRLVEGSLHNPDVAEPTMQKAKGFDLPHHRGATGTGYSCAPFFKKKKEN